MKNIQFNFSLFVGVALNVLGAVILQKDPAGLGLILAGSSLLVVTYLTKNSNAKNSVNTQSSTSSVSRSANQSLNH